MAEINRDKHGHVFKTGILVSTVDRHRNAPELNETAINIRIQEIEDAAKSAGCDAIFMSITPNRDEYVITHSIVPKT